MLSSQWFPGVAPFQLEIVRDLKTLLDAHLLWTCRDTTPAILVSARASLSNLVFALLIA